MTEEEKKDVVIAKLDAMAYCGIEADGQAPKKLHDWNDMHPETMMTVEVFRYNVGKYKERGVSGLVPSFRPHWAEKNFKKPRDMNYKGNNGIDADRTPNRLGGEFNIISGKLARDYGLEVAVIISIFLRYPDRKILASTDGRYTTSHLLNLLRKMGLGDDEFFNAWDTIIKLPFIRPIDLDNIYYVKFDIDRYIDYLDN